MKLNRTAQRMVQSLPDTAALQAFFTGWHTQLNKTRSAQPFSQMTARAILRSAGLLEGDLMSAFQHVVSQEAGLRLTLYDLLDHHHAAPDLRTAADDFGRSFPWESFLLLTFAEKSGYDVQQFDPASPPQPHTPAGIVLHQAVALMRGQISRSATERDRLARHLAFDGVSQPPIIDNVSSPDNGLPAGRPAVPVRYPEFNPDVHVTPADLSSGAAVPQPQRGAEIKITPDEIAARPIPSARPTPSSPPAPRRSTTSSGFSRALRDLFRNETMKTTRLRVIVQEFPDGPGLYGLQVTVASRSIKSFVAGTTDRQGRFLCELPVRLHSGLTYDIDVSWPADLGGATERKTITINADRTEFNLPFYRRLS